MSIKNPSAALLDTIEPSIIRAKKIALLRCKEENNMAFLYRHESKFRIVWMKPPSVEVPDNISRKFVRINFSGSMDVSEILFNIGRYDRSYDTDLFSSDEPSTILYMYGSHWNHICEEVLAGSIALVSVKDIFKN